MTRDKTRIGDVDGRWEMRRGCWRMLGFMKLKMRGDEEVEVAGEGCGTAW